MRKWLAHKDRRRWHLHFTPTSSSWLNLVERWFKELTDKRLRRGVFTSVTDLTQEITVKGNDPKTGFGFDDTKRYVDKAPISDADKTKIFEGNAYKVYSRLKNQIAKQAA